MNIAILLIFMPICFAIISVDIQPDTEFHDKSQSLIVKCNATQSDNETLQMLYYYNNVEHTIPRINHGVPNVYIGNLTLTDPNQYKANVVCINPNNSDEVFGSKIYLFGYSPSDVFKSDSVPKLLCQDFNLKRVLCCLTPTENEIAAKIGLVEERNGHMKITLYNLYFGNEESKSIDSCFNITPVPFTENLSFNLSIKNDLGESSFNLVYDRLSILKPQTPHVVLKPLDQNDFQVIIKVTDVGEFVVEINCSSQSPVHINKLSRNSLIGTVTKVTMDGWKPNSVVTCKIRTRILYNATAIGKYSDESVSRIRLPQGKPNYGPLISPKFMRYETIDSIYLENVVVYFIDLPLPDQNGDIVKYQWKCQDCFYRKKEVSNKIQYAGKNIRTLKLDRARIGSSLLITACTRNGCSDQWSELLFRELADNVSRGKVVVKRNLKNPNSIEVLWYDLVQNSTADPHLIICFKLTTDIYVEDNECTSIQLKKLGHELAGSITLELESLPIEKIAFIPSLDNGVYSQIEWSDCIYESVHDRDVQIRLSKVKFDRFISNSFENFWNGCVNNIHFKIPSCKEFRFVAFKTIIASYESSIGIKNISEQLLKTNQVKFRLTNLYFIRSNKVKIFALNSENKTMLLFVHSFDVEWSCLNKNNVLIPLLTITLIALMLLPFCFRFFRAIIKRQYYHENNQNPSIYKTRTDTNSIKPLDLNNTIPTPHFYEDKLNWNQNQSDSSGFSSENTNSTTDGLSIMTGYSNSDKRTNSMDKRYTERPNIYSHLLMPCDKS